MYLINSEYLIVGFDKICEFTFVKSDYGMRIEIPFFFIRIFWR